MAEGERKMGFNETTWYKKDLAVGSLRLLARGASSAAIMAVKGEGEDDSGEKEEGEGEMSARGGEAGREKRRE